jgi:hypothetical protein
MTICIKCFETIERCKTSQQSLFFDVENNKNEDSNVDQY